MLCGICVQIFVRISSRNLYITFFFQTSCFIVFEKWMVLQLTPRALHNKCWGDDYKQEYNVISRWMLHNLFCQPLAIHGQRMVGRGAVIFRLVGWRHRSIDDCYDLSTYWMTIYSTLLLWLYLFHDFDHENNIIIIISIIFMTKWWVKTTMTIIKQHNNNNDENDNTGLQNWNLLLT